MVRVTKYGGKSNTTAGYEAEFLHARKGTGQDSRCKCGFMSTLLCLRQSVGNVVFQSVRHWCTGRA